MDENQGNSERIEIVASANFNKVISQANSFTNTLKQINSEIKSVKVSFDKFGNSKGFTVTTKQIKETKNETKKLNTSLNKTKSLLSFGFKLGSLYALWNLTKRIRTTMANWIKSSVDFIETTNKFEVAMGNMSDSAYDFQERLSKAFGTVRAEMMNYQATFKNIMSSLPGLTNKAAEQVSETLVKLGLDYSSLYNVDQKTAMSRIQAALVGSVKPIRSDAGYDITEATIGMKAQELGIGTSVRNLNQMEKRLLRIIVLMDQMRNTGAMQDLARTIERPANQIKVLKNQVQELGVWLGNVFIGTIGKILPYINGFVMALVEIAKTLAIFVGYTNTGSGLTEGLQEAEEASTGIATGIGGAAKSAKELRKTLMGFDVLNVIQKQSDSSGGGGGGGSSLGGVNPAILKALEDYDNLMDKVKMKATDIRDKIMEWLGFTKEINPKTGEITWKLKDGYTNIEKIRDIIIAVVGTWLGTKAIDVIGKIVTGLGEGGVLGAVNKIKAAIVLMAGSWVLAKNASGDFIESLNLRGEGNLDEGINKSNLGYLKLGGSVLGGTLAGTLIGNAIGGPIGAIIGTGMGSILTVRGTVKGLDDSYTEYLNNITGENYSDYLDKARKAIEQQQYIEEHPEILEAFKENNLDYGIDLYNQNTKSYVDSMDTYSSDVFASDEAREYAEEMRNLALAEVQLMENGGESIDLFYNKYKILVDGIAASYNTWNSLFEVYTTNNQALLEASDSLELYLAKLSSGAYKITAEDISEINDIIQKMTGYVEASGKAFVDATVSSTQKLVDEGYISQETADLVVESAIRKAQAEGDAAKAYEVAMQDLTEQYNRGKISQEEFNQKAKELYDQFLGQIPVLDKTKTKVKDLKDEVALQINLESWDRARTKINDFGDTFIETKDSLAKAVDAEVESLNELIHTAEQNLKTAEETEGKESELYKQREEELKALQDAREQTLRKYDADVADLQETTYENLKIIEDQLIASGYDINKDSEGIYKALKENFNKIGKDTDVEKNLNTTFGNALLQLVSHKKKIKTELDAINKNVDGTFSINFNAQADYHELANKLRGMRNIVERMANIPIVGSAFVKYKNNLDNLINQLPRGYAQGGFPDMGELFVAREAGPELVGSIGGRNAVVNNDQIVEAVSSGVANAVASVLGNGGSSYQLIIDGEQITNVVQRRLSRRANITGMAMGV